MNLGFGNNVRSTLASDINATQTTIRVMPGTGRQFAKTLLPDEGMTNPSTESSYYSKLTLTDSQETVFEICHLIEVNEDTLTVIRGQEGTLTKGWSLGDVVSNFATRGSENNFVQIEDLQNGRYLTANAGGTENSLTISIPSMFYINNQNTFNLRSPLTIFPQLTNTGPCTLQLTVSGMVVGTFPIVKGNGLALLPGDIVANTPFIAGFSKELNLFVMVNPSKGIIDDDGWLKAENNLSDVSDVEQSRQNLSVYSKENLNAKDGAYKIGYGLSTVGVILDGLLSVQKFMTPEEIADANSSNPIMDHSHAFVEAFSQSILVYIPPVKGCYIVGDVEAPLGVNMRGFSYKPYTVSVDSDFYGCGSVIRKRAGASSIFKFRPRTTLEGIVFDGLDKATSFVLSVDSYIPRNFRAVRCGFYRHQNAIGGTTGKYIGVQVTDCQIANNYRGVYNTVDSMFTSVTINANDDDGVNLQTGANDNSFVNCRMEWNGGNNFYAFGALNNTIIGELCDRAGKAGIALSNRAEVFVIGVRMRRNGRYASGTSNCTHFRMEGAGSKLIISAVETKTGADDDGGGATTPEYTIYTSGSSTNMTLIATGSNLGGSTGTHIYSATGAANTNIIGNIGVNNYSNTGANRTVNGYNFAYSLTKQHMNPTTPITLPMKQPAYGETSRFPSREIQIISRNVNTGSDEVYTMKLHFATESFGPRYSILEQKSVPAGRFGTSDATVIVSLTELSDDVSTFNIVLVPSDAIEREVNIFLI